MARSVEYVSLLSCTEELISEISVDPLALSGRLVTKGLIPPSLPASALLSVEEKEAKARELVQQVTNKVKTFPKKFNVFIDSLREFIWLEDIAQLVCEKYDELKAHQVGFS